MAGPWEKFQPAAEDGPWAKFGPPTDDYDYEAVEAASAAAPNAGRVSNAAPVVATPDFSNVIAGGPENGSFIGTPNYSGAFTENTDNDGFGAIALRALVGRAPEIVANLVELPANANEAATRALGMTPSDTSIMGRMRGLLRSGAESVRELGYQRDMEQAGYGEPSVSGGELVDALDPRTDVGVGERMQRVATFIPETLIASAPDMAATLNPLTLGGYIGARTNEIAENRAANDQREDVSLADLATGGVAAPIEALLERFTTMRLLPQGTTLGSPGVREALTRIVQETGLQGGLGGVEELVPYLAEQVGTQAGTDPRAALETFIGGLVAEGGLGGAVQSTKEAVGALRPGAVAPTSPEVVSELFAAAVPQPESAVPVEDTADLDALLAQALPPEVVETVRAEIDPGEALAAAAIQNADARWRRPDSVQPDTPPTRELADPAARPVSAESRGAELVAPRAPSPNPEQSGQTPAGQSAPVPAGVDLADQPRAEPVTSSPIAAPTAERRSDALEQQRLSELRALHRAGGLTPELSAELLDLTESDRLSAKVAGRRLRGVQTMEARNDLETAGALKSVQAFADADNFKAVNDRLGHEIGDNVIRNMGELFARELGQGNVFHRGGDEFVLQADTPEQLDAAMVKVRDTLGRAVLRATLEDGSTVEQVGVGFSYGAGSTIQEAERAQYQDKAARKQAGLRTDRRDQPRPADPVAVRAEPRSAGQEAGEGRADPAERQPEPVEVAENDRPDPPLDIRYGKRRAVDRAKPIAEVAGQPAQSRREPSTPAAEYASGIPAGLPVGQTDATRRLAGRLNGLGRPGGEQARFRQVRKDALPEHVRAALSALEEATDTEVVVVRNLNRSAYDFNGLTFRDGVLYVDETADHPVAVVAAHEFTHQLRADAPDLYRRLEEEVRRQGNLPAWTQELRRRGDDNASLTGPEELTANAVGDAMADPAFLRKLAASDAGLFRRVADAFLDFLERMTARVKGLGSEEFLSDVEAFRDVLLGVLHEYTGAKAEREATEPVFNRKQTGTSEFRRWFGESKVVDADGRPLVVYHGSPDARFIDDDGTFKSQRERYGFGRDEAAHWFATSEAVARSYMDPRRAFDYQASEPGMVAAYLKLENPLIIDAGGKKWREAQKHGKTGDLIREARDSGHDGAIIRNVRDNYQTGVVKGDKPTDTYVVFDSKQIKSATANRGTFDPSDPNIMFSRREAEAKAESRRDEARGTAGWNYDENRWEGVAGQAKRLRVELQDKMLAWRDAQDQLEAAGRIVEDTQNVYRLENLMHGRVSDGIEKIEREQVAPLVDAMRAAKVDSKTLEEYLYARHAKERNASIAKINSEMPDGGSGMTNAEADKILSAADTKLEALAKRVDAIVRSTRRRMLGSGLITQEQFDAMEAQYQHYVPLRGQNDSEFTGDMRGARGVDSRATMVKQALGRGAGNRAKDVLGEIIGDAQRSVILAEKARVGRAVMRLVLANPNPKLWTLEPVTTERTLDANGEVYERVVNDWNDPAVVAVRHKGQVYRVKFEQPELAKALNHVGVDNLGVVTRFAGKLNRYFSAVLTKYNPAFVPVNATRDALFGLTGMAAEHGEPAALDAALHYPLAARAAWRHAVGKTGGGPWDRWVAEFASHGGKTGYVAMPSAEDLARDIGNGALTGPSANVKRAVKPLLDHIGYLNDAVENALRLSAYVTLRKQGKTPDAAAEYAKNLTVNFNRKGYSGSALNAWFLFYNAALQGAHRTSKLMRKPKTYGYLGALAAVQVVATMAALGMEGDDGEPLWNKIPDHVKRRNLVIVLPPQPDKSAGMPEGSLKPATVVTIPMPYGFNLFPYMAGRIAGAVADGETSRTKLSDTSASITADAISAAAESFVPVPIGDGAMGFVPTIVRIPLNVQTNRDDFGRAIHRENMGKFDLPRASMGKPDTLEVFKLTASGLNKVGGGDEYTPPPLSAFDWAPEDIEYLLGELTGGTGKFLVDVATVGQKATDPVEGAGPKLRDVPIANRFASTIDEQAAQQALFYQRRDVINRSLERVRDTFEREGDEAAEKLLAATPELKGASFKRRKRDGDKGKAGDILVSDGRPQIIVSDPDAVFGRYKTAEDAVSARNESIRESFGEVPARMIPDLGTRLRDARIRDANASRATAQSDFTAAWTRDVVGAAE